MTECSQKNYPKGDFANAPRLQNLDPSRHHGRRAHSVSIECWRCLPAIKVRRGSAWPTSARRHFQLSYGYFQISGSKSLEGKPGPSWETGDHSRTGHMFRHRAHLRARAAVPQASQSVSAPPLDRKELRSLPASGSPVVASVMSWVQAASLVQGPEEEGTCLTRKLMSRSWCSGNGRAICRDESK